MRYGRSVTEIGRQRICRFVDRGLSGGIVDQKIVRTVLRENGRGVRRRLVKGDDRGRPHHRLGHRDHGSNGCYLGCYFRKDHLYLRLHDYIHRHKRDYRNRDGDRNNNGDAFIRPICRNEPGRGHYDYSVLTMHSSQWGQYCDRGNLGGRWQWRNNCGCSKWVSAVSPDALHQIVLFIETIETER